MEIERALYLWQTSNLVMRHVRAKMGQCKAGDETYHHLLAEYQWHADLARRAQLRYEVLKGI